MHHKPNGMLGLYMYYFTSFFGVVSFQRALLNRLWSPFDICFVRSFTIQTHAHTHTHTHGSFIVIKIRTAMKATMTKKNPEEKSIVLFNFVRPTALDRSRIMNPRPPIVKRKLEASPSIIYWPLTRYCMKATGRGLPNSSAVCVCMGVYSVQYEYMTV